MSSPRLNPLITSSNLIQLFAEFSNKIVEAGLEKSLVMLVKIRASQINGCARCLQMHTHEARKQGESEDRIVMLDAWRESPEYTARERAALAWTEALTLLAATRAPDDVYDQVKAQFSDEETVKLTLMINVINAWNRIGVGSRLGYLTDSKRTAA